MIINQISIFIENRAGRLSEITGVLGEAGIDIRAMCLADTTNFGILRVIVNDPDKAESVLRESGMTVTKTQVIAVCLADHPGALHEVLECLSNEGIGVEYAYAFITRKKDDAYVILRVEDNVRAIELFERSGVRLLRASEVYSI